MNRKTIGSKPVRIGWGDNTLQKNCVHIQFSPSVEAELSEQVGAGWRVCV